MAQTVDIEAIRKLSTAERVALVTAVLKSLAEEKGLPEQSRATLEALSKAVKELDNAPTDDQYDESAPDIVDVVKEIWSDLPDSAWDQLPHDGAKNIDHYLYGAPRKP